MNGTGQQSSLQWNVNNYNQKKSFIIQANLREEEQKKKEKKFLCFTVHESFPF
jgi:hypothetical protein